MDRQQLSDAYDRLEQARAQGEQANAISAAKEMNGIEGEQIPNAPQMGSEFDQASGKDGLGPPKGLDTPQGVGSQQVQDTGAQQDMRPSPEMADHADRERHQKEMARDAARAEHYRDLAQDLEQRQDAGDRDKDMDLGLG